MDIFNFNRRRSTVISLLGGYLNTAILIVQGLVLVPFYLRFIGAHTYGLWLASGGIIGLLGMLNFGMGNIMTQRIAKAFAEKSAERIGRYFVNGAIVYFFIFCLFVLFGLFLSLFLGNLHKDIEITKEFRGCFQLAVLSTGLAILNECSRTLFQSLLKPLLSNLFIAVSRILGTIVSIFALYKGMGLWAIPLGTFACELFILILGAIQTLNLFLKFQIELSFSKLVVLEYLREGVMMFASSIGSSLSRESDPLLINYFLGPEITAAYMISRRAADIVFQLVAIISGAIHGGFSHLVSHADSSRVNQISSRLIAVVAFLAFVGFLTYAYVNLSFIILWVGSELKVGQDVISLLGLAFMVASIKIILWQIINGFGDFNYASKVLLMDGVGRILLSAFLLNFVGLIGVPLSLLVLSIISIFLLYRKLQEKVRLEFDMKSVSRWALAILVLFLMSNFVENMQIVSNWLELVGFVLILGTLVSLIIGLANRKLVKKLLNWGAV